MNTSDNATMADTVKTYFVVICTESVFAVYGASQEPQAILYALGLPYDCSVFRASLPCRPAIGACITPGIGWNPILVQ